LQLPGYERTLVMVIEPQKMEHTMTVQKLSELLQDLDPDAEVLIMSQENWPFECSVKGLVDRNEFEPLSEIEEKNSDGRKASDIFIVMGEQLRYGNRDAWNYV
jgi:hypothetical protein